MNRQHAITLIKAATLVVALAPAVQAAPLDWSLNLGIPGVVAQFSNVYAQPPVYYVPAPPPPPVVYYTPGYVVQPAGPGYGRPWHGRGPWRHGDDDHHGDDDR